MTEARNDNWLPTRSTLIGRLKDWQDGQSWAVFFDSYGPVVYRVALKAGFSVEEAQDIVQETIVAVAKQMSGFEYDRSKGSFKSWLLRIARSKMTDRWRKSSRLPRLVEPPLQAESGTSFLDRQPDGSALASDELWEREWQAHLLSAAQARLKSSVDPRHYQIFDCYVNKGWPPATVAAATQVKVEQVYIVKQRLTARLKDEVQKLREEWRE